MTYRAQRRRIDGISHQQPKFPRVYVATLPPGVKDPDELVRTQGPDAMRAVLDAAVSGPYWHGQQTPGPFDLTRHQGRDACLDAARSVLANLSSYGPAAEAAAHREDFLAGFAETAPELAKLLADTVSTSARPTGAAGSDVPPPIGDAGHGGPSHPEPGSMAELAQQIVDAVKPKRSPKGDADRAKDRATWQEALRKYKLRDLHNAERLAVRCRERLVFVPTRKLDRELGAGWHFYVEAEGRLRPAMRNELGIECLGVLEDLTVAAEQSDPDSRQRALLGNWAAQSNSPKGIRAMADLCPLAAAHLGFDLVLLESDLDQHRHLLNVRNGTLDLYAPPEQRLRPHSRELNLTRMAPVDFVPDALCPLFDDFLAWMLTDPSIEDEAQRIAERDAAVAYFWRLLGYSLAGWRGLQVMVMLHGLPRSGKSTLNNVIMALLGAMEDGGYVGTESPELLLAQRGGGVADFERRMAGLVGCRLVFLTESGRGAVASEAEIKRTTGGERVMARNLYSKGFSFVPEFVVWYSTNDLPVLRQADEATTRRLAMLPCPNQISVEDRDFYLDAKIIASELPGILNRALAGLDDLRARMNPGPDASAPAEPLGYPPPAERALRAYKSASDAAGEFIAQHVLAPGDDSHVPMKDLWAAYTAWAHEEGYSRAQVGRRIELKRRLEHHARCKGWHVLYDNYGGGMTWKGLDLSPRGWHMAQAPAPGPDGQPEQSGGLYGHD